MCGVYKYGVRVWVGNYLLDEKFQTETYLSSYDMQNVYARFKIACESENAYYFKFGAVQELQSDMNGWNPMMRIHRGYVYTAVINGRSRHVSSCSRKSWGRNQRRRWSSMKRRCGRKKSFHLLGKKSNEDPSPFSLVRGPM